MAERPSESLFSVRGGHMELYVTQSPGLADWRHVIHWMAQSRQGVNLGLQTTTCQGSDTFFDQTAAVC